MKTVMTSAGSAAVPASRKACDCEGNVLTSAAFVAVPASQKVPVIAKATCLTSAGSAAVPASQKGRAIVKATCLTSVGSVAVPAFLLAPVTAKATCLTSAAFVAAPASLKGRAIAEGNVPDECGVCGGGIPAGACDCEGNVLDECGVCGGPGIRKEHAIVKRMYWMFAASVVAMGRPVRAVWIRLHAILTRMLVWMMGVVTTAVVQMIQPVLV